MTQEFERQVGGRTSSDEEYDQIADKYDTSFQIIPYRTHVEQHSTLQIVGEVQGLQVLDVACGTGHYSRLMRKLGAARVVGVDLSPDMVRVARQAEEQEPLGNIEYYAQDAGHLDTLGQFDLVVAVYLFHYATSLEHLQGMCHSVARNLRPGGRFVTYALNPDLCTTEHYYSKYLVDVFAKADMRDGDAYSFAFKVEDGWTPPLTVYYWSWDAMEVSLQQAGFGAIQRRNPTVSPTGLEQDGPGFWHDYLSCPHCIFLDTTKESS